MPTSDYHPISAVLDVIEQIKPASILDIGVGFGRWGILCREILEIYNERMLPDQWKIRIEGIEIHEPFRNPFWSIAYDKVHIGNASEVISRLGNYDLIICGDVIEHFDKEAGEQFLKEMLKHGQFVIVTSPNGYMPQGATHGDEYQRHRSGWTERDFRSIPYKFKIITSTFVSILSSDQKKLDAINFYNELELLGVKKGFFMLFKLFWVHAMRRLRR